MWVSEVSEHTQAHTPAALFYTLRLRATENCSCSRPLAFARKRRQRTCIVYRKKVKLWHRRNHPSRPSLKGAGGSRLHCGSRPNEWKSWTSNSEDRSSRVTKSLRKANESGDERQKGADAHVSKMQSCVFGKCNYMGHHVSNDTGKEGN